MSMGILMVYEIWHIKLSGKDFVHDLPLYRKNDMQLISCTTSISRRNHLRYSRTPISKKWGAVPFPEIDFQEITSLSFLSLSSLKSLLLSPLWNHRTFQFGIRRTVFCELCLKIFFILVHIQHPSHQEVNRIKRFSKNELMQDAVQPSLYAKHKKVNCLANEM
jgi:hypothetical protein